MSRQDLTRPRSVRPAALLQSVDGDAGRRGALLEPRNYDLWIDRGVQEPVKFAEALPANAVSTRVNDPRHDDARCLEPVA